MIQTAAQAIRQIDEATSAADIFAGEHTQPAAARRARRSYRMLVALIHPDLAAANGIDPVQAGQATAKLNDLYLHWWAGTELHDHGDEPHVVGEYNSYRLQSRISQAPQISSYATDRQQLIVAISRTDAAGTDRLIAAARRLNGRGLAEFGPEIVDHGLVSGKAWVAYRLPVGLHSLRQVRAGYPDGLDGRDWAWMARRILMVIDAAGEPDAGLGLDSVLVHPQEHGLVLTGWGAKATGSQLINRRADLNAAELADLFDQLLDHRPDARRQRDWARAIAQAAGPGPGRWLDEYDLLLRHLYGERRYRPFSIPGTA